MQSTVPLLTLWQGYHATSTKQWTERASTDCNDKRNELVSVLENDNLLGEGHSLKRIHEKHVKSNSGFLMDLRPSGGKVGRDLSPLYLSPRQDSADDEV
jgi:hypothetical protein